MLSLWQQRNVTLCLVGMWEHLFFMSSNLWQHGLKFDTGMNLRNFNGGSQLGKYRPLPTMRHREQQQRRSRRDMTLHSWLPDGPAPLPLAPRPPLRPLDLAPCDYICTARTCTRFPMPPELVPTINSLDSADQRTSLQLFEYRAHNAHLNIIFYSSFI